jgi:hypothetical protein
VRLSFIVAFVRNEWFEAAGASSSSLNLPRCFNDLYVSFRRMFEELEAAQRAISDLSKEQSTEQLLEPTPEDERLLAQLVRNKEEQEYLRFECELIESKLKQRIGTAAGLRGVATWKTQIVRRFNESLFRSSDPERYQGLLERYYRLDTTCMEERAAGRIQINSDNLLHTADYPGVQT